MAAAQYVGKTYIVTGGASGLGEATVRRITALGGNVALFDRDEERGEAIAKELGQHVAFFKMDAMSEDSIKAAVDSCVEKFKRIDGAINCAGIGSATLAVDKSLKPHPSQTFDMVMQINLYGTFNVCKYAAAYMAKQEPDEDGLRGVLVNVASVAAEDGQKGQVAYAASKGAVKSLTLPLSRDLGKYGIRVVCVLPGIMETPLMAAANDNVKKGLAASVVAPKRLGLPQEFALMATQIIENKYLNGTSIRLDGGIRMGYQSKV